MTTKVIRHEAFVAISSTDTEARYTLKRTKRA